MTGIILAVFMLVLGVVIGQEPAKPETKESLLPVLTLILGGVIGLVSSLVVSFMGHRRSIALRLLDQFLDVRKSVVDAVSDLTNVGTDEGMREEERKKHRKEISKLFYRHFDFLPKPVLDSLALLEVGLLRPEAGPYTITSDGVVSLSGKDLAMFVDDLAMFGNSKLYAALALASKDRNVREIEVIRLHARHVLHTLNQYFTIQELSKLLGKFSKATRPYSSISYT